MCYSRECWIMTWVFFFKENMTRVTEKLNKEDTECSKIAQKNASNRIIDHN